MERHDHLFNSQAVGGINKIHLLKDQLQHGRNQHLHGGAHLAQDRQLSHGHHLLGQRKNQSPGGVLRPRQPHKDLSLGGVHHRQQQRKNPFGK